MEKDHYYVHRDNFIIASQPKTVIQKEILKPSIKNTGFITPPVKTVVTETKPTQTITLTKPVVANTPVILAPNVEGGLKVENPSPINVMNTQKILPEKFNTTQLPAIQQQLIAEKTASNNKQASFTLPNMWIMIAMVAGVIALMVLSKRKK